MSGLIYQRDQCGDCGGCVAVCFQDALELFLDGLKIKENLCTLCGDCVVFCPSSALKISNGK